MEIHCIRCDRRTFHTPTPDDHSYFWKEGWTETLDGWVCDQHEHPDRVMLACLACHNVAVVHMDEPDDDTGPQIQPVELAMLHTEGWRQTPNGWQCPHHSTVNW